MPEKEKPRRREGIRCDLHSNTHHWRAKPLAPPSPHPLAARVLVSFSVVDDCAVSSKTTHDGGPPCEASISRGSCGVGAAARAELKLIEGELRSDEALRLQAEARPADVRPRLPAVVE